MTTTTQNPIAPVNDTVEYEPSVADKIQRIIYRLEHGEELSIGSLYDGQNFCVLGLFADESGLGEWTPVTQYTHRHSNSIITEYVYNVGELDIRLLSPSSPPEAVTEYYNLKADPTGVNFNTNDLPLLLRKELTDLIKCTGMVDLYYVNDMLIQKGHRNRVNSILAGIIRSGVLFNKD